MRSVSTRKGDERTYWRPPGTKDWEEMFRLHEDSLRHFSLLHQIHCRQSFPRSTPTMVTINWVFGPSMPKISNLVRCFIGAMMSIQVTHSGTVIPSRTRTILRAFDGAKTSATVSFSIATKRRCTASWRASSPMPAISASQVAQKMEIPY